MCIFAIVFSAHRVEIWCMAARSILKEKKKISHMSEIDSERPIDFVILYCDGSDPAFIAKRSKYLPADSPEDDAETGVVRIRDYGTLPYWFRAVEQNAPWVRKIHLVTDDQVPEWIVREHPKLHLVDLKDFIPEQYLPLFNSCAIEIFLHRIEGLSEQFVYFNDDTFLNASVTPGDFFKKGRPRLRFELTNKYPLGLTSYYYHIYNDMRLVNRLCTSVRGTFGLIRRSVGRAYGFKVSRDNFVLLAARALTWSGFPYVRLSHQAEPMLRSVFEYLWERFGDWFELTASHRFREETDLNQEVFIRYSICSGKFETSHRTYRYFSLSNEAETINDFIVNGRSQMLCVNDSDVENYEEMVDSVKSAFQTRYPSPCSFEKEQAYSK